MLFISWVFGIYSFFKAFNLFGLTAFLLIPLWLVFCFFTGIPGIVNILRTRSFLKKGELKGVLFANIISASILFLILEFTNAQAMQSNFFIGGILTAFAMPKSSLVSEIVDQNNQSESQKE